MITWDDLISNKEFWIGVTSSIVASAILGILIYVFRNALNITKSRRDQRRRENELFDTALNSSSPMAPFAYGIVQARALRYFLLAVFVAYVGDILDILWPFNSLIYVLSLFFIFQGLKWFYKIEKSAIKLFSPKGATTRAK